MDDPSKFNQQDEELLKELFKGVDEKKWMQEFEDYKGSYKYIHTT